MFENTNNENLEKDSLVEEDKSNLNDILETTETIEKSDEPEVKEAEKTTAIKAPKPEEYKPGLGYVENGILGSTVVPKSSAKKPAKPEKKAKNNDTVAVHSTRNVTWPNVGKVYTGYNIVSKAAAEQWLKRDHVRLATPEEVAKEFGL
jgi:hypothetical protein